MPTPPAVAAVPPAALPAALEAAAQLLAAARRGRMPIARLPAASRPTTIADALVVQSRVTALAGGAVAGWKCALPTAEKTIVAPIFAADFHRASPCAAAWPAGPAVRVEPEIACVLAADLPPRSTPYTDDEVRAAIGSTHLVLELIGSRYADPAGLPFPELLADNASNAGLFVGPEVAAAFARELDRFVLRWGIAGEPATVQDARHPDGHPLRPLTWLANALPRIPGGERGLVAGDVVTTGSYAGVLDVPAAVPLTFVFGELGRIDVELRPEPQ